MNKPDSTQRAFTLIEMLVVISIIGVIAAMVLGLANLASNKKKSVVASAAVNRLVLMIENYHSKLGFYPPDNAANIAATAFTTPAYDQTTATNQLIYELTGETNYGGPPGNYKFTNFDGTTMHTSDLVNTYGRGGIANSNPDEPHNFYYPPPKPADYTPYSSGVLEGLIVPVQSGPSSTGPNFIHYDSSTTNRHNSASFDVWVEYWAGTDKSTGLPLIITNGNW
ncbi:MAG: type II secretion system protein [Verrucomicrobiota bacterium]|jgi:prepilin-type N-terminal cleavage/methylation domain-containing protein